MTFQYINIEFEGVYTCLWHPTPVLLPGKSDTTERLHFHFSLSCIGEGNGNPLQCSCLQNPRDRGAWWAAVYGVARAGHDWSDLAVAAYLFIIISFSPLGGSHKNVPLRLHDGWNVADWQYQLSPLGIKRGIYAQVLHLRWLSPVSGGGSPWECWPIPVAYGSALTGGTGWKVLNALEESTLRCCNCKILPPALSCHRPVLYCSLQAFSAKSCFLHSFLHSQFPQ